MSATMKCLPKSLHVAILVTIILSSSFPLNSSAQHNFTEVLALSYRFYEAQMSGDVPAWSRASQAAGGWRNQSHMLDGTGPDGIDTDLSGGWYDSGDHLKLHLPLGVSASLLAYGALTWESAYRAAGLWDTAVRNLDWVATYLAKCHYVASDSPAANAFVAQVGDVDHERNIWWGRPEHQPQADRKYTMGWRPVHVITAEGGRGADIVAEAVASLAAVSLLLQRPGASQDAFRSQQLLNRARQLFELAKLLPATWAPPFGSNAYPSSSYNDDMAWAAAWLCRADVESGVAVSSSSYCAAALPYWDAASASASLDLSWDNVAAAAALLLRDTGAGGKTYMDRYNDFISRMLDRWIAQAPPCSGGRGPCRTPGGLTWYAEPGSNRYAANMAFVALAAARNDSGPGAALTPAARVERQCWALGQLSYMLGSNPQRRSFVVGYRPTPHHSSPLKPHHRSSSCSPTFTDSCSFAALDATCPNPSELAGALVAGPGPDDGFADRRCDSQQRSAVALDFNAGLTAAAAGLADLQQQLQQADCDWDSHCALSCGKPRPPAPAPPSPPPPPTPPPSLPTNGSSSGCSPTDYACQQCDGPGFSNSSACRACVAAMRAAGQDPWSCLACGNSGGAVDAAVQGICLNECVPTTARIGVDWSCSQYCQSATFIAANTTLARQCVACVSTTSNPWNCLYCMLVAASQPDPEASRASCVRCVTTTGLGSWACGECAKKATQEERDDCIAQSVTTPSPPPPSATPPPTSSSPPPSTTPAPPSPPPASPSPPAPPINAQPCNASDPNDYACKECGRSVVTAPASCRLCMGAMRAIGQDPWRCLACGYGGSRDSTVQGICLAECVPGTARKHADWACSQYCSAPSLVANNASRARECGDCVAATDIPWNCQYCMQVAASQPDPDAARASCFRCVTTTSKGGWACGECAKKATQAERDACIDPPPPPPPGPANGACDPALWACQQCDSPTITNRTACRSCVATVAGLGRAPTKCLACGNIGVSDSGLQTLCLGECVPAAAVKDKDWACSQYCEASSLVGTNTTRAKECMDCVANDNITNPWDCQNCIQVTASMTDADAARASCIRCITTTSKGSWACGECAKKATQEERDDCIDGTGAASGRRRQLSQCDGSCSAAQA